MEAPDTPTPPPAVACRCNGTGWLPAPFYVNAKPCPRHDAAAREAAVAEYAEQVAAYRQQCRAERRAARQEHRPAAAWANR